MSKRFKQLLLLGLVLADILLINAALAISYWVRYDLQWFLPVDPAFNVPFSAYIPFAVVLTTLLLIAYKLEGAYDHRRGASWSDEFYSVLNGTTTGIVIMIVVTFFYNPSYYSTSRLLFIYAGVLIVALLSFSRLVIRTLVVGPGEKEYFNPYVVGKPVTGSHFVGRQDILTDLITALKGNNHLIIEGERRIGKSSLLYELAEALRQDGDYCFIPAYVQLQRVTEETLFYAIMREIARESRKRYQQLPPLRCEAPYVNYDTFAAEDDLLTIIETLKGITDLPLRVVILLDEGDRLRDFTEETHSLLCGWMGAAIQKDVLILVWCGVSFDRAWHQRTSPWYNQFRSPVEVPPLSPQEARTLITHPVEGSYEYEEEAIERILTLSERKPFVIQLICHECVRRIWQEQSGATITLADVDAVWPLVQRRLESDEQAEASSEDSTLPSLTYQTAAPAQQIAEEAAPYNTEPEETVDDS